MPIQVRCPSCGKVSQYSASDVGLAAICVACGARMVVRPDPGADAAPPAHATRPVPLPPPPAGSVTPTPADSAVSLDAVAELAEPAGWEGMASEPDPAERDAAQAAADALAIALGGRPGPPPVEGEAGEQSPGAPVAIPIPSIYAPRPPIAPMAAAETAVTPPRYVSQAQVEARVPGVRGAAAMYAMVCGAAGIVILLFVVLLLATRPSWDQKHAAEIRDLKSQAEVFAANDRFQEAYDTYGKLATLVSGRPFRDEQLRVEVEQAMRDRDYLFRTLAARAANQYATVRVPQPTSTTQAATDGPAASPTGTAEPGPATSAQVAPAPAPGTSAQANAASQPPAFLNTPTGPVEGGRVEPGAPTLPPAANWLPRPGIRVGRAEPVLGRATPGDVTDEAIGRSIQRGVDYMIGLFRRGRLRGEQGDGDAKVAGTDALAVYALLQASLTIPDARLNARGPLVRDMLDALKAMPAERGPVTYARALRASALALAGRQEDRAALLADVGYLTSSHFNGAYTYAKPPDLANKAREVVASGWDNSNSQYGLLGVWAGAEAGAEISAGYWQAVEDHWTRWQCPNGSWEYTGAGTVGSPTMAAAGVASLFVTHDYLDAPKISGLIGRPPFSPPLARGLEYLEAGDNAVKAFDGCGYGLYGLERVGLASGFKYFGDHDWYREGAARILSRQQANGSWSGGSYGVAMWEADPETAFNLLFLSRGRHPVVVSKLRYEGSWANRPRDIANLTRFAAREIERPLNWQVVPLSRPWTDWTDAPILYVGTHEPVAFGPDDLAKLRSYVEAGGMLFTQADGDRPAADRWASELAQKLFPNYPMENLPEDHAIYRVMYQPSDRPPMRYVTNGSRILMLHSASDISQHWQTRNERNRRGLFELGVNIILYASGKADFHNRLASSALPTAEPTGPAGGGRVAVARVQYDGNWDPEPGAWRRFAGYFRRATNVDLDVAPVAIADLDPRARGFAHWTGTAEVNPSDAEIAAIRKYVNEGGVLLVEPTGGGDAFYKSATAALRKAFPDAKPEMVSKMHPMLTASGPGMDDLSKVRTRLYARARGVGTGGRIDAIAAGRGRVVLSQLDLTTGLLGSNVWGVLGFEKDYAQRLAKNVILWSATGMPDAP